MTLDASVLIEEYLSATRGLPRDQVAAIAGVRTTIVESWERTPRKQIRQSTRLRLSAYLSGGPEAEQVCGDDPGDWIGGPVD